MTLSLPEDPINFRLAFDSTCTRILESETDATFCALFVQLFHNLHENSLLKEYIHDLEGDSKRQKQAFNFAALEALEDRWYRLWKYHRHTLKLRKKLVRIKRMITSPNSFSYSPLYNQILFSMWEFRYYSPFCRFIGRARGFFQTAVSQQRFAFIRLHHFYPPGIMYFARRRASLLKFNKKNKLHNLHKSVFNPGLGNNVVCFRWSAECAISALFSPKIEEFEKKLSIPGNNSFEKRRSMQTLAETNAVFCWERIRFFTRCYTFEGRVSIPQPLSGRWASIRTIVWQAALERCENEVLRGAKIAFQQKLSSKTSSSIDSFIMCEHQFDRNDFEKYLKAFQHHIHIQLFKIESTKLKTEEIPMLILPGSQRKNFVIDLASKYWKSHPSAKHDEVFQDYCISCPQGKILSRTRWSQIVRERHLDPRSPSTKKRGKGKKTSQN